MHLTITPHIDVALLVFDAFLLFFLGLIVYLRREDRREGYPLEDELTGRLDSPGGPFLMALPKTFRLPFGHGTVTTPTKDREPVELAARRTSAGYGTPIEPTGNPLVDGIGPAAWANRAKRPDIDMEGHPRIVPLSTAEGFFLERRDPDPRGMTVVAADGVAVGTVSDVWIDKADRMLRYLQVSLDSGRSVPVPMPVCTFDRRGGRVLVDAIVAGQFDQAPAIDGPDVITLYEEDRVQAYFGGGYLYATPARSEPLL